MSQEALGKVFEKCWKDEAFKKRFLENPGAVLIEHGFEVPEGIQVKVVENMPGVIHLVLPINPKLGELSEDELEQVAGGAIGMASMRVKFDWSNWIRQLQLKTTTQGKECVPW